MKELKPFELTKGYTLKKLELGRVELWTPPLIWSKKIVSPTTKKHQFYFLLTFYTMNSMTSQLHLLPQTPHSTSTSRHTIPSSQ